MSEMVLIGISGKMGSGKDYLTNKLVAELERRGITHGHTAFALPLKNEMDIIINLIREHSDYNDDNLASLLAERMNFAQKDALRLLSVIREEVEANPDLTAFSRTVLIRTGLQMWGTEIRRRQNPAYWTDKFLASAEKERTDTFFATDGRFANEMDTIVDNYGVTFRLDIPEEVLEQRRNGRDGITYTDEQLNHESETALDDYERFDIRVGVTFDEKELVDQMFAISQQKREANKPRNCFPAGTGVVTGADYKDISMIRPGDTVLTHQNRFREVKAVSSRKVSDSSTLHAYGTLPLTSTEDHLYLVKKTQTSEEEWLPVNTLEAGWFVAHPLRTPPGGEVSAVDLTVAYLAGVLVQCSAFTLNNDNKPSLTTPYHDDLLLTQLEQIGAVFQKTEVNTLITHETLYSIVKKFGPHKWSRYVPEWFHQQPAAWQEAFLDGFLNRSPECKISSRHLALGVAASLQNLNPDKDVCILSPAYITWNIVIKDQEKTHTADNKVWIPVVRVHTKPEMSSMEVFDITVVNDESFIADNFIVHNCS
jgi:hypothetical protein